MTTAAFRVALAGLVMTTAGSSRVLAADTSAIDLTVQIVVSSGVDPRPLAEATAIVGRVYEAFGVRLLMRDSAEPSADGRTPWRRIVVKPSATKEFPSAFGTSRASRSACSGACGAR